MFKGKNRIQQFKLIQSISFQSKCVCGSFYLHTSTEYSCFKRFCEIQNKKLDIHNRRSVVCLHHIPVERCAMTSACWSRAIEMNRQVLKCWWYHCINGILELKSQQESYLKCELNKSGVTTLQRNVNAAVCVCWWCRSGLPYVWSELWHCCLVDCLWMAATVFVHTICAKSVLI